MANTFLVVPLFTWLIQGAVGPAVVGLPVTWAATDLAGAAKRWFRRLRRSDDLSRIVRAAAGADVDLSDAGFAAIRNLLQQPDTWVLAGQGTVEDVAFRIGSLPELAGPDSLVVGRAIAQGLLEFTVRDLEPEWFQRILFARLDRLQADQASVLDQVMLGVHADLAALLSTQDTANEDRSARLLAELERVLERLAPGPAGRGEVAVYLATLVRWLNTDPWPQDTRFAGPVLIPAEIERKLTIRTSDGRGEKALDADDLARSSARLVVLGDPGSGKTWLARRTARLCAEAALNSLAAGADLDEIELPLYTTCARLSAAPPGDGIRRAVVTSALGQLPDLGGARILDSVRVFFEERNAATLLVADSLDEATGADDRIRQADTLPVSWRIVLTSRPSSWNGQLAIGGPSRQAGGLLPLRYPDDVEAFVSAWFRTQPAQAEELLTQLRDRPMLQRTATDPLILTLFCILGGGQALPSRPADVNAKVIRRMLTGRWRGSGSRSPDINTCLKTLRDWAWSAAAANPVSGTGSWIDEFPTSPVRLSEADRDALDHLAVPQGPADVDTGMILRRFVHRSFCEHLVAEYMAMVMSAEEAASELLNHLWYDPDWRYVAPKALAMHPQRDEVLKILIRLVGEWSHEGYEIDGCWEIHRFLTKVAVESSEDAWSPEAAEIIGKARQELVIARPSSIYQIARGDWSASNSVILRCVFRWLAGHTNLGTARDLANSVTQLAATDEDQAYARKTLLRLFNGKAHGMIRNPAIAGWLAKALVGLNPTNEDRAQARKVLLRRLVGTTSSTEAELLAEALAALGPTSEDRVQAREALQRLLVARASPIFAQGLAGSLASFMVTEEDQAQTWDTMLRLIENETDRTRVGTLAEALAQLTVGATGKAQAQKDVLRRLDRETRPQICRLLVEVFLRLDPPAEDRRSLGLRLLRRGARYHIVAISLLAGTAERPAWTPEDDLNLRSSEVMRDESTTVWRMSARHHYPSIDADLVNNQELALGLLTDETDHEKAEFLASMLSSQSMTERNQERARTSILLLLASGDSLQCAKLAATLTKLGPAAEEQAEARQTLIMLLRGEANPGTAEMLADAMARLSPTLADLRGSYRWPWPPSAALLGAVRKNTKLSDWIAYLPLLSELAPWADRTAHSTTLDNE